MESNIKEIQKFWGAQWEKDSQLYDFSSMKKDRLNKFKFKIMKKYLDKLPINAKVLEVGCGIGFWLDLIHENYPRFEIHGLDFVENAKKIIEAKKYGFHRGDAREIPFKDNYFDFVFSIGVVEHFPENQKAIHEHIRITKPNGFCLIEVPNRNSLLALEEYISHRHIRKFSKRDIMSNYGLRFTFGEISAMCSSYLGDIRILRIGSGPVLPIMHYTSWLDWLIPSFIRRYYGGNAGVIVRKINRRQKSL